MRTRKRENRPSISEVRDALRFYERLGQPMAQKNNNQVASDERHEEMLAKIDESIAIANAPATLPGFAPTLPYLPADLSKARRLSDVSRPAEANITKDKLIEWGNLYLVGSQHIVTNYPKQGDSAYLMTFRIPEHDGLWSEFFGPNPQREMLHNMINADNTPIGPMWLEHILTRNGNEFYRFTENRPMRVTSVVADPFPTVAQQEDDIPF